MLQNNKKIKNWSCYEVSSIPMIYFISDTRGIMGKGRKGRLHIDIFFGHTICISLLVTCLNQFLPVGRNWGGGGGQRSKGKRRQMHPNLNMCGCKY